MTTENNKPISAEDAGRSIAALVAERDALSKEAKLLLDSVMEQQANFMIEMSKIAKLQHENILKMDAVDTNIRKLAGYLHTTA